MFNWIRNRRKRKTTHTYSTTRQRSGMGFTREFELLEDRLNPGSANPANVTAIYDAAAHSLSVSFQEAIGSRDTPVYGAAFLDPASPSANGGINVNGFTTNGSNVVTFSSGTTTLGLLAGQTVTGTGIPSGTTIVSVDSSSQVTLSKAATATSLATGTSLTFTLVMNGTLTSGSNTVTGLASTAGLWVGESLAGTGIPIPKLPSNPTAGTPETITTITSIGADGHSITLSANATASGTVSLTFISGLALDGSGMEFMANVIDTTTVYTFTYTYSDSYQNPFLLTAPPEVCMTLYHNTGVASGFHSVVGDGPGWNTDNSITNNNNNDDYQVYSGLVDVNLSGKFGGGENTPTSTLNGTLKNGSNTVTGLSSTSGMFVGEYVTGSGLPAGDQVASIGADGHSITLAVPATANGGKPLTFDTVTVGGYRIINGAVDLNRDGAISNADSTKTLAGHPGFAGFNVINGKVDLNGNGKIDANDTGDLGIDAFCATPTIINNNPATGSLSGFVYFDANQDGVIDTSAGDHGIGGVPIHLQWTDSGGVFHDVTTFTADDGSYSFTGLEAGDYTLVEEQPTGFADGADYLGSLGGTLGNDILSDISLAAGQSGINYNYTELLSE